MNQDEINTNAAAGAAAGAAALVFTTAFAVVTTVAAAEAAAPAAAFELISSWFMMVSDWFLIGLSGFLTSFLTWGGDHYASCCRMSCMISGNDAAPARCPRRPPQIEFWALA